MSGRRVDVTGKRALFEAPVQAAPEALRTGRARDGRDALFSSDRRRPGTVLVECESCTTRTRVSMVDLGLRFAAGSAWLPLLRAHHPHWLRCPACGRRTWCRIGWSE